jgi:hypothetical protein
VWLIRLVAIAIVSTVLLIPIAGFASNITSNKLLLIVVSFGTSYVLIPMLLLRLWPAERSAVEDSIATALWSGELLTTEYTVHEVVEVEEVEDEGFHFLLSTGENETLFLSGQYLYGLVEQHKFPSSQLRVFRHRTKGHAYGIEPIGSAMKSWRCLSCANLESVNVNLEDGQLVSKPLDALVAELGLEAKK